MCRIFFFQDTKMEIDVLKTEIDLLQKGLRYYMLLQFLTFILYLLNINISIFIPTD